MAKSREAVEPSSRLTTALTCSALAIAIAFPAAAVAQQAATPLTDPTKLDDVTVTARKVSESIDTIPLAITAMPSAKIEERNLTSIQDVSSFSPGFYTQMAGGTASGRNDRSYLQLTFRGIGANANNLGVFAGGTAFLDGSPVLNSSLSSVQDLERVEVLKGPQSAYFGRSTFAGAVNYITKDPTEKWTGRVSTEVGQHSLNDTGFAISGALLPDVVSFRLSVRHFSKDGQYNTDNQNIRVGDQRTDSAAITLLIKPFEGLKIRPYFNHFEDDDGPPAQYVLGGRAISPAFSNCNLGGSLGAYYCGQVPQKPNQSLITANLAISPQLIGDLLTNTSNLPVPFNFGSYLQNFGLKRKADQASNKIEYVFDSGMTATATSAYHQEKIVTLGDIAFRAEPANYTFAVGYKDYDFSQELRLTSSQDQAFRWAFGGNYVKLKQSSAGIIGEFGPFGLFNSGAPAIGFTQAETPSVFGGLYLDVLPALTLSAEGRYQSDKISGHYATTATTFVDLESTYKTVSPRLSIDYKITPTAIVYALASRGYKPGGFNNTIASNPQFVLNQFASVGASVAYGQEKLDNYEAGIKGSFLDGKVRTALTGYVGKYRNAQVPVPVTFFTTQNPDGTPNTNGPFNVSDLTQNIGLVNLKGAEFEVEAIVYPGLRIGGTFAHTGTDIRSYSCGECANILAQNATGTIANTSAIGKRLPGAPQTSYTLSTNYEHSIVSNVVGYIGGDFIYRGTYYADAANIASSGASKTFNLRIGARQGNYTLELFARNLFDNQSPTFSYSSSDLSSFFFSGNSLRLGLPDRRRLSIRGTATF